MCSYRFRNHWEKLPSNLPLIYWQQKWLDSPQNWQTKESTLILNSLLFSNRCKFECKPKFTSALQLRVTLLFDFLNKKLVAIHFNSYLKFQFQLAVCMGNLKQALKRVFLGFFRQFYCEKNNCSWKHNYFSYK